MAHNDGTPFDPRMALTPAEAQAELRPLVFVAEPTARVDVGGYFTGAAVEGWEIPGGWVRIGMDEGGPRGVERS